MCCLPFHVDYKRRNRISTFQSLYIMLKYVSIMMNLMVCQWNYQSRGKVEEIIGRGIGWAVAVAAKTSRNIERKVPWKIDLLIEVQLSWWWACVGWYCHGTLNCESLLRSELACREKLVRKDNRWLLVVWFSYTGGAPSTCLQARLSNRRPLPCRQ